MQDFIQFVASQPSDKKVNHDSWHSCAVGEYAKALDLTCEGYNPRNWIQEERYTNPEGCESMILCINATCNLLLPRTTSYLNTLYDVLRAGHYLNSSYDIHTYGGLLTLINDCTETEGYTPGT